MTIVFSAVSSNFIVMTVDSAVTFDFQDSREYVQGRKSYFYPGVGCVTTWGARDHNRIGEFLNRLNIAPSSHTVNDLAVSVKQYLTEEYRPHELNLEDVGYHIGGFDRNGRARLFHVFWGFDRPRPPEQVAQKYEMYEHSPSPDSVAFLYNGRNDLAEVVVRTLLDQIISGSATHYGLGSPIGLACFGDFVARFAAELTPEVGPPFLTYMISPHNKAVRVKNDKLCPVSRDEVAIGLRELGYSA